MSLGIHMYNFWTEVNRSQLVSTNKQSYRPSISTFYKMAALLTWQSPSCQPFWTYARSFVKLYFGALNYKCSIYNKFEIKSKFFEKKRIKCELLKRQPKRKQSRTVVEITVSQMIPKWKHSPVILFNRIT